MMDLEELARVLVGDDGQPNVFFITDRELKVLALVTTCKEEAIAVARVLAGADTVEDRQEGLIWQR